MISAPDRAFIIYLVAKTKDRRFKKLALKMGDNRMFSIPMQIKKFEKIAAARREFESLILKKMESDSSFTRDFIEKVESMSVMTSEHAKLKKIVNCLHAAAVSQLSKRAAHAALEDIFDGM